MDNILYEKEVVALESKQGQLQAKILVTQEINCYLVWFFEPAKNETYLINYYSGKNGKNRAIERGVELGQQSLEIINKISMLPDSVQESTSPIQKEDTIEQDSQPAVSQEPEISQKLPDLEEVVQEEPKEPEAPEEQQDTTEPEIQIPPVPPEEAIQKEHIVCLECGKSFKMLSKVHLAFHGLTPSEYRYKWGYDPKTSLTCEVLLNKRRKQMEEFNLWKKRKS